MFLTLPTEGQPMALATATNRQGTGAALAQGKFQKLGMNVQASKLWFRLDRPSPPPYY